MLTVSEGLAAVGHHDFISSHFHQICTARRIWPSPFCTVCHCFVQICVHYTVCFYTSFTHWASHEPGSSRIPEKITRTAPWVVEFDNPGSSKPTVMSATAAALIPRQAVRVADSLQWRPRGGRQVLTMIRRGRLKWWNAYRCIIPMKQ